jgi:hypothetical protein
MSAGESAAKAVRERSSSVLLSSVKRGRDIRPVLADLYVLLDREQKGAQSVRVR